ncbi:hypothetical protein AP9108_35810 [Arthrospira sp. PCC 9108]|nr:hypothetical protein AP9108_35810 [Arthrospira sp. PCC 9108]
MTAEPAPTIINYPLGRVYSLSRGDGELTAEPAPTIINYPLGRVY